MWKLTLAVVIFGASLFLAGQIYNASSDIRRAAGVTTIEKTAVLTSAYLQDAGASKSDAGVTADAGVANTPKRPTAQQLADEFLIWELKELVRQAKTPEDKALAQEAYEIKDRYLKKYEMSNNFETNMRRVK